MSENRYQSGEEPRKGDLVERVDTERCYPQIPTGTRLRIEKITNNLLIVPSPIINFTEMYSYRFKLIERADPGCPYKIGDTLAHAGSKRTGVVQEFKRYVHPTTKEVRYHAIVSRPFGRLRNWDLRRCSLATPAEQPEQYPYYVVNRKGEPFGSGSPSLYAICRLSKSELVYTHDDGHTEPCGLSVLTVDNYLAGDVWKRVNTNPFNTQSKYWTGNAGDGNFNNPANWKYQPADERGPITAVPGSTVSNPFIGIRSDTGETVRASDLKREPEQLTYYELLVKYNTLRDQLDTVTRHRNELSERVTNQAKVNRQIKKERDEATQAADKLQTQLNECRNSLTNHICEVKELRKERDTLTDAVTHFGEHKQIYNDASELWTRMQQMGYRFENGKHVIPQIHTVICELRDTNAKVLARNQTIENDFMQAVSTLNTVRKNYLALKSSVEKLIGNE